MRRAPAGHPGRREASRARRSCPGRAALRRRPDGPCSWLCSWSCSLCAPSLPVVEGTGRFACLLRCWSISPLAAARAWLPPAGSINIRSSLTGDDGMAGEEAGECGSDVGGVAKCQVVVSAVEDDLLGVREPGQHELTDLGEPRPAVRPTEVEYWAGDLVDVG